MNQTKDFHVSALLTVATGKFLTLGGMEEFYKIYSFMMGENLYTHQLPRAIKLCQSAMLEQYPQFKNVDVPDNIDKSSLGEWLKSQAEQFGEMLPVKPLVNQQPIDPIEEAISLGMEVVIVSPGESDRNG